MGPLGARGRRHVAGGAQIWGGAGHPKEKKGGGCCPLHTSAQGARRPPGRAQGRWHRAGGGQPLAGGAGGGRRGPAKEVVAGSRGGKERKWKRKEKERKEKEKERGKGDGRNLGVSSPASWWPEAPAVMAGGG